MKKIVLLLLLPSIILAGTTGKIAGKVTDASSGEALIGASILLVGTTFGAATDVNGNFVILNIPPGTYSVKVSFVGYNNYILRDVRVIVDQTTNLTIKLTPASVEVGEVVVSATANIIQKDLTSSKSVINSDEIEALPVTTFTELLALQAGVVGSGSNLYVRGGRSNEVAYLIDGMYVKDPLLGSLATKINNDAIQEMSLLSGTFNAEYGNALSGIVNVVTKEGSENYHAKLEARTSEFGIQEYSRMHQLRINASISGPIYPENKSVRFFLSGEQDKRGSYLPFGNSKDRTALAKLTFLTFPQMKLTTSYRFSDGFRRNYNHDYKYIPDRSAKTETKSQQAIFSITHTLANNLFYDFRYSYFDQSYFRGFNRDTSIFYAEPYELMHIVEDGRVYTGDFYSKANPNSLTDSRTKTHDLRFDMTWQWNQNNEMKLGFQYKKHSLSLLAISGIKRPVAQQYVDDYSTDKPFEASGYVQDKIEFPYLVINLGLRFDYLNANVSFRDNPLDPNSIIKVKSRSQFSPRIGIAHPISDRTKLHFSYGHFFQNPDYQYLFENKEYKVSVREPIFGQPSLDAERTIAYEVGLTHLLTDRISLNLTAYYKDITGLIGTTYRFPYFEGRYVGYTLYVNEDYANVKGFEVNVDVHPDRNFSGGLTYTYSVAKGSASSETEQYPGTQESTLLYYLNFDKTHVFHATGTFTLQDGEGPTILGKKIFENSDVSLIFSASSGYPYTPSGRDVGFVIKNSLRLPATYTLDMEIGKELRVYKDLKLRIFAEILNVTNHKNVLYVYPDTGDPEFTLVGGHSKEYQRDPSNFGPPRIIRLGFGMRF